jgi:integrase
VPKIDFFQAYKTNARMGFMKPAEYQALRMALPPHLKLIFITAYHCGGRLGELTQARIEDVDFERQRLFLRPEVTKTEEGRYLPIYGDMVEAFKRTIAQIQRDYPGCPWLFPNEHGTDRVKTFYKAWAAALKRAGLPENILFHDLRRTAVRNMIRAGVPRKLAMSISGHKTEDVFERYHIIDETDFEDARQKMEQFHRGAS